MVSSPPSLLLLLFRLCRCQQQRSWLLLLLSFAALQLWDASLSCHTNQVSHIVQAFTIRQVIIPSHPSYMKQNRCLDTNDESSILHEIHRSNHYRWKRIILSMPSLSNCSPPPITSTKSMLTTLHLFGAAKDDGSPGDYLCPVRR
jgi:hypothetical protein